jgi:hypothetical protein
MYKVISFDIEAGGNGKSEFLDKRTAPEVRSIKYAALALVSKEYAGENRHIMRNAALIITLIGDEISICKSS